MNKKRCAICGYGSKDYQGHISHLMADHGIQPHQGSIPFHVHGTGLGTTGKAS